MSSLGRDKERCLSVGLGELVDKGDAVLEETLCAADVPTLRCDKQRSAAAAAPTAAASTLCREEISASPTNWGQFARYLDKAARAAWK
eukprot:COSAG06_NODE_2366_length_7002_cov_11.463277_3_plen_88_part_00